MRAALVVLGVVFQVLTIVMPSTLRVRLGLPAWPWLFVFGIPLQAITLGLIMFGMRRARENGANADELMR